MRGIPGRTFNLFRFRASPGLCCAIPQDCPVPDFLNGDWSFAGTWTQPGLHSHGSVPRRPADLMSIRSRAAGSG
jgi:hypothetical protein